MKNIMPIAIALLALTAAPAVSHEQHNHATYSAGEPGKANKPSRTIEVTMSEMEFNPSRIEVKRGEQIRFIVRNAGTEDHEFLLASTEDNLKHGDAMKKNPRMAHDDPNGVRLAPKKSAEILWKFTKTGTFEFACLIPDHREYGMTGRVTVK